MPRVAGATLAPAFRDDRGALRAEPPSVSAAAACAVRSLRQAPDASDIVVSGALSDQRLLGPDTLRPPRSTREGLRRRGGDLLRQRRLHYRWTHWWSSSACRRKFWRRSRLRTAASWSGFVAPLTDSGCPRTTAHCGAASAGPRRCPQQVPETSVAPGAKKLHRLSRRSPVAWKTSPAACYRGMRTGTVKKPSEK